MIFINIDDFILYYFINKKIKKIENKLYIRLLYFYFDYSFFEKQQHTNNTMSAKGINDGGGGGGVSTSTTPIITNDTATSSASAGPIPPPAPSMRIFSRTATVDVESTATGGGGSKPPPLDLAPIAAAKADEAMRIELGDWGDVEAELPPPPTASTGGGLQASTGGGLQRSPTVSIGGGAAEPVLTWSSAGAESSRAASAPEKTKAE